MFVSCVDDIKEISMNSPEAKRVGKRILVGPREGWKSHVMRFFRVEKEGFTPRHSHPWPHINYIVNGEGVLYLDGKEYKMTKGCVAYVPSNSIHQYINTSEEDFVFICIVPKEGETL